MEQSDLLSQFPGAVTRAERICHDETCFPTKPPTLTQSPAPLCSGGGRHLCLFPTFIQKELWQHRSRQSVFGKAQQGAARTRGLWHGEGWLLEGSGSDGQHFTAIRDKNTAFFLGLRHDAPRRCLPLHPACRKQTPQPGLPLQPLPSHLTFGTQKF